jgi:isopentenyldiphosphate isomerase
MYKKKIIIVDKNDKILEHKYRKDVVQEDIYRVSALWIKNSQGDILLAQRSFDKKNDPGMWGVAVAGTVDKGETYEKNIIKETEEEIGIKNIDFVKTKKDRRSGKQNYFRQWFVSIIDKDIDEFNIQKEEVEAIKWFKKEKLIKELKTNPDKFLHSTKNCVKWFK